LDKGDIVKDIEVTDRTLNELTAYFGENI